MSELLLIAQTTAPAGSQPQQPGMIQLLLPFILMFGVLYLMVMRPQRRERDKHSKMLEALKKNDRVMTIGGLFGVVANIKGDEVTLKVDESTNTKLTFSRTAIKTVLSTSSDATDTKAVVSST